MAAPQLHLIMDDFFYIEQRVPNLTKNYKVTIFIIVIIVISQKKAKINR